MGLLQCPSCSTIGSVVPETKDDKGNITNFRCHRCGTLILNTTREEFETIDHPAHYGGADNPYEAIKVIEAWKLGFNLGNTVKYIARAEHKGNALEDLRKAAWYLNREIENLAKKTETDKGSAAEHIPSIPHR